MEESNHETIHYEEVEVGDIVSFLRGGTLFEVTGKERGTAPWLINLTIRPHLLPEVRAHIVSHAFNDVLIRVGRARNKTLPIDPN